MTGSVCPASCSSVSAVKTCRTVALRSARRASTSDSDGRAARSRGTPGVSGISSCGRSSGCHGAGRAHLYTVAAVQLGLHQADDVDSVDSQVVDLAADVDVDQGGAADHGRCQVDLVETRVGQVDVVEVGPGQVDVLEARAAEVRVREVSHRASIPATRSQPGAAI
jgi:hypothetical protein